MANNLTVVPLGGYAAKQCPTRTYHDIATDTTLAEPDSPGAIQRMADGVAFEAQVEALLDNLHPFVDLDTVDTSGRDAIARIAGELAGVDAVKIPLCDRTATSKRRREILTMAALSAGVSIIWNARLPQVDGRVGEPDLLIDGYPVDVKHHKVLAGSAKATSQKVSGLDRMSFNDASDVVIGDGSPNKSDNLQLAHYLRMLDALGHPVNGEQWGGIIGKELTVVWRRLDVPTYRGKKSALDVYDESFAIVRAVADAAVVDPDDGPLIPAVWKAECGECPWRVVCHDDLVDRDHVSLLPGITQTRVEVHAANGITTRRQLARLDSSTAEKVDAGAAIDTTCDPRTAAYATARTSSRAASLVRTSLVKEIDQARVTRVGQVHRARGQQFISVPRAAFELDVDIEDADGRCYLIGVADTWRRRSNGTLKQRTDFHAFVDWTRTDAGEARIFADFWAYLTAQQAKAANNRWGFRVYYYTDHETRYFRHLARKHAGTPGVPTIADLDAFLTSDAWVDLHKVVSQELVWPTENHQLKTVARHIGHVWRDEAPGGANSMAWFANATEAAEVEVRDANKARILEYNEDDVLATLALRDWLTRVGDSRQPGKALPSVEALESRFAGTRRRVPVAA